MARIAVLGGTGYAGSNIAREAARRGHQVTAYSHSAPAERIDGVTYIQSDVLDPTVLDQAVTDTDVVVCALSPRGDLEGKLEQVAANLIARAQKAGVRLGVVGGTGPLLVATGGPKVLETEGFPAEFRAEAKTMDTILEALRASPQELDWFYLSPASGFGAWAPGEATGKFRLGGDQLLVDDQGNSFISGPDFATAFVDEIEAPAHRRQLFTVAY